MFDDETIARRTTFVAGLILLIVLAAVVVLSAEASSATDIAEPDPVPCCRTIAERLAPGARDRSWDRMVAALAPIDQPMQGWFPDEALVAYDIGIAPTDAFSLAADLLEEAAPALRARLGQAIGEFRLATGLDPARDFLPFLERGIAVGLLPPEGDGDGWPLPRKVVIARVTDPETVSRFLEAWFSWLAGSLAPTTNGLLGASIHGGTVAGLEIVTMQLDGLLPARVPLPSPSYVVAGGHLVVSPVRSAVVDTVDRLARGPAMPPAGFEEGATVEVVRLNFPAWPAAWRRAEPVLESLVELVNGDAASVPRACRTIVHLFGDIGPTIGSTSLRPDGGLVLHFEIEPPVRGPE